MGFWAFIFGGAAANVASNKLSPPIVTPPDGYEIRGIKAQGASRYIIRYAKKGSSSTSMTTIGRSTTGFSGPGGQYKVYW